jgi:hypothetical protein
MKKATKKKTKPVKAVNGAEPEGRDDFKFNFESRIVIMPMSELESDPENPRTAKRKDMDRLKKSLQENPNMLMLRPVVWDLKKGKKKIIAGDKRFRAWGELGHDHIPTIDASRLSEKEKKHFMLWDNENVGQWDFPELEKWPDTFGIKMPDKKDPSRYNDLNAEMPIVPRFDERYRAVLIVVETEMDFANLCTVLDLGKAKDYKTSTVKQTQVISFTDFMKKIEEWKK